MHFSFYVVNLPLAYGEDTDEATAMLKEIADGHAARGRLQPFILEPLE
jgi:hypothetical protein